MTTSPELDADTDSCAGGGGEQQTVTGPVSKSLPNSLGSRVILVLVNLFLIPATGALAAALYTHEPPREQPSRVIYYLFAECVLFLFVICMLSFLWAIARPLWIARVFDGLYTKFLWVVFVSFGVAWLSMVLAH